MQATIKKFWQQLQPREQWVLVCGILLLGLIVFYTVIWHPWHRAINNMTGFVQTKRTDLTWMRQQAEIVKQGGPIVKTEVKGKNQSVLAVVERTAKSNGVSAAIQQLVPGGDDRNVSVVLETVSFNKWVRWIDQLHKEYGVNIKQLSAERDSSKPDIADIRVTFERTAG